MLRTGAYVISLAVWIAAALLYPEWTGWVHTQQSSSSYGPQTSRDNPPLIWLHVPVYPKRALVWDPPRFFRDPNRAQVRWPWQPAPSIPAYIQIVTLSVAAQVTAGALVLALIFGWSYPFSVRAPDYAAGIALGGAYGLVWGWFIVAVLSLLELTSDGRLNRDMQKVSILASALFIGAAAGAWRALHIRRSPGRTDVAGRAGAIVQITCLVGGLMLGFLSLFLVGEIAVGLSRFFGWSLTTDPSFGTYANAPALDIAVFLLWIAMLSIAWIRWRRGPRAFAVGLALSTTLLGPIALG